MVNHTPVTVSSDDKFDVANLLQELVVSGTIYLLKNWIYLRFGD